MSFFLMLGSSFDSCAQAGLPGLQRRRPSVGPCISYEVRLLPMPPVTSAAASANRCWRGRFLTCNVDVNGFLLLVRNSKVDFGHSK